MKQSEVTEYLQNVLGPASPLGRDKALTSPLRSRASDQQAAHRERLNRLFSDYRHGAHQRFAGEPVDVRPLSLAERISAYMAFYAPVLSQDFRRKIGNIVNSETKVSRQDIAHSPFLLRRMPELDASLIGRYSLEQEKERLGGVMRGFDTVGNTHHYIPHTMGGIDFAPNTIDLPARFHWTIHLIMDNLPPHLGLLLIPAWMRYDNRDYARHEPIREGIVDLFRDYGRRRDTDLDDIYDPVAVHGQTRRRRREHRNDREIAKKNRWIAILRESLRVGKLW